MGNHLHKVAERAAGQPGAVIFSGAPLPPCAAQPPSAGLLTGAVLGVGPSPGPPAPAISEFE